jgi:hypothetical protein
MHLTLKKETTKPAGSNFLQLQAKFDDFIEILNQQRPHQALDLKVPRMSTNLPRAPTPACRTSTIPSTIKLS